MPSAVSACITHCPPGGATGGLAGDIHTTAQRPVARSTRMSCRVLTPAADARGSGQTVLINTANRCGCALEAGAGAVGGAAAEGEGAAVGCKVLSAV
jgi:hypothetical protein